MDQYKILYQNALDAGKEHNYWKSLELFEKLATITDEYPQAYLYMGRCCHALKNPAQAISFFKHFLVLKPKSAAGKFFMGRSYLALGASGLALRNLLKVDPRFPGVKAMLGLAYMKRKKFSEAANFLGQAVEESPKNQKLYITYLNALFLQAIRLFYREDYDMATQIFHFLEKKQDSHILLKLYMGMIEREQGNFENSLVYFNQAVEASPNDQMILLQRSEVLYLLGQKGKAREDWARLPFMKEMELQGLDQVNFSRISAVEHFQKGHFRKAFYFATKVLHREKDPSMHLLAGEASRNLGDWDRAKNHFRRALDIDKNLLEPRYGLAMLHWHKENYGAMRDDLKGILRRNPEDAASLYYLALCREKLEEPVEDILPLIQQQIHQIGPDPYLFNALGNLYIRGGMPELSEKWYRKALELQPDYPDPYTGLFFLAEGTSHKNQIILLKEYLNHHGTDHNRKFILAELLVEDRKFSQAIPHLEAVLPFFKKDRRVRRLLALAYKESRKYHKAALIYKEFLKEDPKNVLFLRSLVYCLDKDNRRPLAIELMEKAQDFIPATTAHLLILGVLLHKEKKQDEALKIFRQAAEKGPTEWEPIYYTAVVYKAKGMEEYAANLFARAQRLKEKG